MGFDVDMIGFFRFCFKGVCSEGGFWVGFGADCRDEVLVRCGMLDLGWWLDYELMICWLEFDGLPLWFV